MNTRSFLLLERLQKLDALLRLGTDPLEAARLRARKSALRRRLTHLMPQPA
jgi:hypothetical protein